MDRRDFIKGAIMASVIPLPSTVGVSSQSKQLLVLTGFTHEEAEHIKESIVEFYKNDTRAILINIPPHKDAKVELFKLE